MSKYGNTPTKHIPIMYIPEGKILGQYANDNCEIEIKENLIDDEAVIVIAKEGDQEIERIELPILSDSDGYPQMAKEIHQQMWIDVEEFPEEEN